MGAFYTNISLSKVSQKTTVEYLQRNNRVAFVSPSDGNGLVVYDKECESQDPELLGSIASELSQNLRCAALALMIHDDDVLLYQLYKKGKLVDEYNSSPSYFEEYAEPAYPVGGNAKKLCKAFGGSNVETAKQILRKSSFDDERCVFATLRHYDLAKVAGLPMFSVGFGYSTIEYGELPDGMDKDKLISVK